MSWLHQVHHAFEKLHDRKFCGQVLSEEERLQQIQQLLHNKIDAAREGDQQEQHGLQPFQIFNGNTKVCLHLFLEVIQT